MVELNHDFSIDDSRLPVKLASPLRVPSYAFPNWGIPKGQYRRESDAWYFVEWEGGSQRQNDFVGEAAKEAGLGDCNEQLRNSVGLVVSRAIQKYPGSRVNITDVCSGPGYSVMGVYRQLSDADKKRIFFTLVDASGPKLEDARRNLHKLELVEGRDYRIVQCRDVEIGDHIEPESQHILTQIAGIHAHAYLDTPLQKMSRITRRGGIVVSGDWHNRMWEHPRRVYDFLATRFDWPTKEADLEAFRRKYGSFNEVLESLSSFDEVANEMIREFWLAWGRVRKREIEAERFKPEDDFWMLEGHRPVEQYMKEFEKVGFELDTGLIMDTMWTNPWPLKPHSSLLMVLAGQKVDE